MARNANPKNKWCYHFRSQSIRDEIAGKIAIAATSTPIITEMYNRFPEARRGGDDANRSKDRLDIANAIYFFNPLDKRFKSKRYGGAVQDACFTALDQSTFNFLPAYLKLWKRTHEHLDAMEVMPEEVSDITHVNHAKALQIAMDMQAQLVQHGLALLQLLKVNIDIKWGSEGTITVTDPGAPESRPSPDVSDVRAAEVVRDLLEDLSDGQQDST